MANEIRLRANNISGAINDNPLTNVATTINSPSFADLPVVDSTNHLILILDPLEVIGAAEIVIVTAHTVAATSVTVLRGQEGSVARQHPLATVWFHGPVGSDWNYTQRAALSTNRPASPFNGELIYETNTNRWTARSSGNVWAPAPFNPPTCRVRKTANQSINNNTQTVVTFDDERWDTDNMHDNVTNNNRITFNTAGLYIVTATGEFTSTSDFLFSGLFLSLNGTTTIAVGDGSGTSSFVSAGRWMNITTVYRFVVGDWIQLMVQQANGAGTPRTLVASADPYSTEFSATWIGIGT